MDPNSEMNIMKLSLSLKDKAAPLHLELRKPTIIYLVLQA